MKSKHPFKTKKKKVLHKKPKTKSKSLWPKLPKIPPLSELNSKD